MVLNFSHFHIQFIPPKKYQGRKYPCNAKAYSHKTHNSMRCSFQKNINSTLRRQKSMTDRFLDAFKDTSSHSREVSWVPLAAPPKSRQVWGINRENFYCEGSYFQDVSLRGTKPEIAKLGRGGRPEV